MSQYRFDPGTYEAMMAKEVPAYHRLQEQVAAASVGHGAARILDLGTGTGVTARSVLRIHPGDVIVPTDPGDIVTPIDGVYDTPSTVADQLLWLQAAGFVATTAWLERDLAVLVGDLKDYSNRGFIRPSRPTPPKRSNPRSSQARITSSSEANSGTVATLATHSKTPSPM